MAKKRSNALFMEVCGLMVSQGGAVVTREPEQVAQKVIPAAKAFIDHFGGDAPLAVKCLGFLVGNIFLGMSPVENYFSYPERVLAILRSEIDGDELPSEDGQDVPQLGPKDPVYDPKDPASVKAAGELESKAEDREFAVSSLEISDEIKRKLYENEIGSTSQIEERHKTSGFPFLTAEERKIVLIAFATITQKEVVIE